MQDERLETLNLKPETLNVKLKTLEDVRPHSEVDVSRSS